VLVVDHVADILELFEHESELGVREMARRAGISKSAAQRLAAQLAHRKFLWQDPDTHQYRLGLRLLELGALVQTQSEVASVADPLLDALMRGTGETVHLAWLDSLQALCVAKLESTRSMRTSSRVGRLSPLHCTSAGKAVLAFQSNHVIEQVIARGLPRVAPNTIVDPDQLRRELADIRARGFALDLEECEVGLCCVAAPVRDQAGVVFAAVSVAAPVQRMPDRTLRVVVPRLHETADRITRGLTSRPMFTSADQT
jgi:DNA-binding IclR family transcriptional regulator